MQSIKTDATQSICCTQCGFTDLTDFYKLNMALFAHPACAFYTNCRTFGAGKLILIIQNGISISAQHKAISVSTVERHDHCTRRAPSCKDRDPKCSPPHGTQSAEISQGFISLSGRGETNNLHAFSLQHCS